MTDIASLTDVRVNDYARVGDPDWLLARGLFVAEGRLVVRRLFETRTFNIRSVLVTRAAHAALEDVLDPARCPIYLCAQDTMNQLAGFNFHRGCLALGERLSKSDRTIGLESARCLMALEGVGNPDNVGGLFRVAAAFGVDGILLDRTSGDPLYRKAIRTSMGAVFRVPFVQNDSCLATIAAAATAGAEVIALTPNRSAMTLVDYVNAGSPRRPRILLLGAEGPGLSGEALAAATSAVRIPIVGAVDSLNVVVAAGIALAALVDPCAISPSTSSAAPSLDRHPP